MLYDAVLCASLKMHGTMEGIAGSELAQPSDLNTLKEGVLRPGGMVYVAYRHAVGDRTMFQSVPD